jgi:hypothetical protein
LNQAGIKVRNKGKQERKIQTIHGVLPVRRSVLKAEGNRTSAEGGRREEIIPLDDYLKITNLPFKMSREMMAETAFWGQHESSFKSAEMMLRKSVPTRITDSLIEEVTYYVGKRVYEDDTGQARSIERNMDKIPDKAEKEGILYIMADGSAVNTRQKDEKGSTWKENKLGMVFTSEDLRTRKDGTTQDIQKKEYVSYIGPAQEFKKYLFECAVRNGYGRYEKTVIVSDGAAWIRNMGEELFPDALQILDFYHLAENLYSFGKYLFGGDEKQYVPWAEELVELMRESKSEEVLKRLAGYKDRKLPPGIINPYTYIQHNHGKVDYAEFKRQGYYIGSGPIESANKTVVQKRCKQAGMMWNERNAQYMLTLKSKEESGLWGPSVRDFISTAA